MAAGSAARNLLDVQGHPDDARRSDEHVLWSAAHNARCLHSHSCATRSPLSPVHSVGAAAVHENRPCDAVRLGEMLARDDDRRGCTRFVVKTAAA
jgi:hypothetical protein